jgi:hypothetical protein
MKTWNRTILVAVLAAAGAGCATASHDTYPSASVRATSPLAPSVVGEWRGTISGREMASALHNEASGARLLLSPDGTFMLEQNAGQGVVIRSTGRAVAEGDKLVLDGRMTSPASYAGEPVTHLLRQRGDGLYGEVETTFRGNLIETGVALKKSPGGGGPQPGAVQTGG